MHTLELVDDAPRPHTKCHRQNREKRDMSENHDPKENETQARKATIAITLNAFSFLQKKLKKNGFGCYNVSLDIPWGTTPKKLLTLLNLLPKDVEGIFINGLIKPFDTIIQDGDRVGLLPPGTPGPYRVMLGIVQKGKE